METRVSVEATDSAVYDSDDLAPARGLLLGMALGAVSLGLIGSVLWLLLR